MIKSYSESDIKVTTSALDHIESNPRMYIGDNYVPENLIARLVSDLIISGSNNLRIERHARIWKIFSDIDWLIREDGSVSYEEFYSLVPMSGKELFRDRVLVIINAFSVYIHTIGSDGLRIIKGKPDEYIKLPDDIYISKIVGREIFIELPGEINIS